jgi:hypothetical protein
MAHFFTKHEMKKYDKKLTEENYLDANRFKNQLRDEISRDNHRTNIDSAKKKAVLQCMNYDGFHQMVLGADLKGIKPGDLYSIKSNQSNTIMNNTSIQNKYNENIEILQNAFTVDNKEIKTLDNILKNKEKNEMNFNQKTFIKEYKIINLNKNADNNNENLYINLSKKIDLINLYGEENFQKMLDEAKLQSDVFLDLVNTFGEILTFYFNKKDFDMISKCFINIKIFFNAKNYSSSKIFIGKKQKNLYNEIIRNLEKLNIELNLEVVNEKNKIEEIINFLKIYFK